MTMKKIFSAFILFCVFAGVAAGAADAATMNARKRSYNKNALPYGWQSEAGYTLWRVQRGLAANPNTYKKYRRDRAWRQNLHRGNRPGEIMLDTYDWTNEEIAKFWENYQEWLKFHPAGVVED